MRSQSAFWARRLSGGGCERRLGGGVGGSLNQEAGRPKHAGGDKDPAGLWTSPAAAAVSAGLSALRPRQLATSRFYFGPNSLNSRDSCRQLPARGASGCVCAGFHCGGFHWILPRLRNRADRFSSPEPLLTQHMGALQRQLLVRYTVILNLFSLKGNILGLSCSKECGVALRAPCVTRCSRNFCATLLPRAY